MKDEVMGAQVELSTMLGKTELTLRQLSSLQVGDIIPIEVLDRIELLAEEMPVCKGSLGVSNNCYAIKIDQWVRRRQTRQIEDLIRRQRQTGSKKAEARVN